VTNGTDSDDDDDDDKLPDESCHFIGMELETIFCFFIAPFCFVFFFYFVAKLNRFYTKSLPGIQNSQKFPLNLRYSFAMWFDLGFHIKTICAKRLRKPHKS
jgi:hypothetical protein